MNKYISIYQYAKKHGVKSQSVYRWIREGKFLEEDVKTEEVKLKRMRIKEDAKNI